MRGPAAMLEVVHMDRLLGPNTDIGGSAPIAELKSSLTRFLRIELLTAAGRATYRCPI